MMKKAKAKKAEAEAKARQALAERKAAKELAWREGVMQRPAADPAADPDLMFGLSPRAGRFDKGH